MRSGKSCQIKPFDIDSHNRILPPIQEQVGGFVKKRLHPTLPFTQIDRNEWCELRLISGSEIFLESHAIVAAIRELSGNHDIANSIVRYRTCRSQIKELAQALFVKCVQNDIRIIAVDIARHDNLLLAHRMGKEIDIQSFRHKRELTPILCEQQSRPVPFKTKKEPIFSVQS